MSVAFVIKSIGSESTARTATGKKIEGVTKYFHLKKIGGLRVGKRRHFQAALAGIGGRRSPNVDENADAKPLSGETPGGTVTQGRTVLSADNDSARRPDSMGRLGAHLHVDPDQGKVEGD